MYKTDCSQDLIAKAEQIMERLYGISLNEAIERFLERAVQYPLLVNELGLASIRQDAIVELRENLIGL